MSNVLDRKRDVPAARVLPTNVIRSGAGEGRVPKAPLECEILDERAFERMLSPAKKVKPSAASIDRHPAPPLLAVALAFLAALATFAMSVFWPYLMLFVTARG